MTEAEILEQLATHGDRVWSIVQYWTSVSFAMLIAGHFAADRVHWLVLIWFGLLYAAFTLTFVSMAVFDGQVIRAGLVQLQGIGGEGRELGLIGQTFVTDAPLQNPGVIRRIAGLLMFFGLFFTTLVYPAYCHFKNKDPVS